MASIRTNERADGSYSYTVLWRDPKDGLRSRTYDDADKAKDLKAFLDANGNSFAKASQAKAAKRSKAPLVHAVILDHVEQLGGDVEPGTRATYRGMIPIYFGEGSIGHTPVDKLTREAVREWFDNMDRAVKTKKNVHALLSAALRTELRRGKESWIETNVAEGIRSPKSTKKTRDPVFLTKKELKALTNAMPSEVYRRMVDLKAYTGLRWGEITALRPSHIRNHKGRLVINVREAWKRHAGKTEGQPLGAPKTSKGTRSITIGKKADKRFRPWLESVENDNLIFTVPSTGEKITSSYFSRIIWTPTVAELLKKGENGEKPKLHARPTPHDLRHTHASMLIEAGVDFLTIQERLGHESITTTTGTYGHLRNDADANAADALD